MKARSEVGHHLLISLAKVAVLLAMAAVILLIVLPGQNRDYLIWALPDSRTIVWLLMELHLMFAAFILGVPIFTMIVEIVSVVTKDEKYDRLAWEFTRLLALAFTSTGILGVLGLAGLIIFYPGIMVYLGKIFSPTYLPYAVLIVADAFLVVIYYYAWDAMKGRWKWLHIGIGALLNLVGTALMCVANTWATFMMSPAGVTEDGALVSLAAAIANPLWMPLNIHRFLANIAFGGAIAAAYGAIRFLGSKSDDERSHYDWMGYVGNFIAMWALIPLPFAGYYLGKEIYAYSAQMGTSLMGGAFSWLWIIQAILIGVLFISANYYMWMGLGRIPGGRRYYKYVLWMVALIFISMAIWMTPHTLVASLAEARRMGGAHHPLLGVFGVMSAKNTVVNLVILTTFLSFVFYRRANKERITPRPRGGMRAPLLVAALSLFPVLFCGVTGFAGNGALAERRLPVLEQEIDTARREVLESKETVSSVMDQLKELGKKEAELARLRETPGIHHAAGYRVIAVIFAAFLVLSLFDMFVLRGRISDFLQGVILATAAGIVIYFGVKGYFVPADVRIGYSVYQVMAVLYAMIAVVAIDLFVFFGARSLGDIKWGKMPARSQYILVLLAVTFTLLIGLMGFIRSAVRGPWHVYGIVRDLSPAAYNPTMGYGGLMVGIVTVVFLSLLSVIFWFGMRERKAT